ncbi:MAG TPA: hypothetical protein VFP85_10155 [Vicinamibacterales bacterium]|nr:hypothetical protein [Vicinamibacterales bacterium]
MLSELRHRDSLLFWTGGLMLLLLVLATLVSISDTRQILGLSPWIKPMKFMISITIFLWSVAWFMPETEPRPLARAIVRWTIASAMTVEILMIVMQSARGTTSHFNHATAFDDMIFSIMGLGVVFNTLAMALFLWIVRRDTPPSRAGYIWGIRLGVAMFLLASLQGTVIVGNDAHSVPGPDGGPGLPFVNWSTTQGDLRVAHFFGMHALQALPLLGFLLDRARLPIARNVVVVTGILWLAITGGLLMMALRGRPLIAF